MRCGDIIGGDNINAIGFIGAGKCGMSLAYYFRSKGVNVIGFSSRSNNTEDFELYSREKLINNSDIIFITTNDDNIQTIISKKEIDKDVVKVIKEWLVKYEFKRENYMSLQRLCVK